MNFFKNMLTKDGKVSSKRVVTFVCLIFMLMGYTANLFWDFTIDSNLFESLQWIVMAGLGFTASEQFSTNGNGKTNPKITKEYDYGEEE
jgi:hypothetical protein